MGQVRYFCTIESVGYGSSLTLLYSTARIVHCFALKPQKWGLWVQFDIIKKHGQPCTSMYNGNVTKQFGYIQTKQDKCKTWTNMTSRRRTTQ